MPGRTLFDKIWTQHVVAELPGDLSLLSIDRNYLHDLEGGPNFTRLEKLGYRVHNPDLTYAMPDHAISSAPGRTTDTNPTGGRLLREMRRGAFASGVKLFDIGDEGQGIVHVAAPEMGLTLPGATVVCPDSHTCTHGAFGALAIAIGSSEVSHVLATQTLRQKKPKIMRITFNGPRAPGVTAKDVILATIGKLGTAVGRGYAVEYAGALIGEWTIEERLTICNLSIELGSKTGIMAPDDSTYQYLAGRPYAPKDALFDRAVAHWRTLPSDDDAVFDAEHNIDVTTIAPQITWGTSPQDVIDITGHIPDPSNEINADRRKSMEAALKYMGLTPGDAIEGTPIDWVFIGSCTNGRLSDSARGGRCAGRPQGGGKCARLGRSRFGGGAARGGTRGPTSPISRRRVSNGARLDAPCASAPTATSSRRAPARSRRLIETLLGGRGRARAPIWRARPRQLPQRSPGTSPMCESSVTDNGQIHSGDRGRRSADADQCRYRSHHSDQSADRKQARRAWPLLLRAVALYR